MEACSLLVNLGKGMHSSSEQPLVGEEHCVTTLITAAKETIYGEDCRIFLLSSFWQRLFFPFPVWTSPPTWRMIQVYMRKIAGFFSWVLFDSDYFLHSLCGLLHQKKSSQFCANSFRITADEPKWGHCKYLAHRRWLLNLTSNMNNEVFNWDHETASSPCNVCISIETWLFPKD